MEPTSGETTSLDVSWTAPDNDGRPEISGYNLQYRVAGTEDWTDGPQGETGMSAKITGLTAGTAYQVQVQAINVEGTGDWSDSGTGTSGNSVPDFSDATLTRAVAENTVADVNIGAVIPSATDADTDDTLTYSMEGTDAASFAFDVSSRQITTLAALDYEDKNSYSVTIKVEDDNHGEDTVDVTISVTDVNEPPDAPEAPTVEPTSGKATSLDVSWTAPNNEGRPEISGYDLQYRVVGEAGWTAGLEGVEGTSSAIADLSAHTDYQVQVQAINEEGDSGWSPAGEGSTTNTAPEFVDDTLTRAVAENSVADVNIGAVIPAATDADNDDLKYTMEGTDERSFNFNESTLQFTTKVGVTYDHEDKSSYSVTIKVEDDNHGGDTVDVTINVTDVNEPPVVATALVDQTATVALTYSYVVPADAFTDVDGDTLLYSAARSDDSALPSWLTFTAATRTFAGTPGASDTGTVTLKVTVKDGADAAALSVSDEFSLVVVSANTAPTAADQTVTLAEDGTHTFAAADFNFSDSDSGDALASVRVVTLPALGSLARDGSAVSANDVVPVADIDADKLTFTPAANGNGNAYTTFTFKVSDGVAESNAASTLTIDVTAVADAPVFDVEAATRSVAENTSADTDLGDAFPEATDADGDTPIYSLEGADAASFAFDAATRQLSTLAALNFEAKASYAMTVKADDDNGGTDTIEVTITVRNLDETGTVSFSQGGTRITAALNDPDGGVSSAAWQWARSSNRNSGWTHISGATSARYTPSSGDQGMYLQATVSYDDAHSSGKQAQGISASQIAPPDLRVATLVSGLSIPWDIAFTPDGTMLFTQRAGVLSSRLTDGTAQTIDADFGDLFASGETGLMGITVDPGFTSNRRFYTCQGHTGREIQVIAWTLNAAYTEATRVADPLVGGIPATSGRHGGCRLRFGPEGYLWIATGDAASGAVPQDLTSLGGKVLRVDASSGAGAPTNPFAPSRVYTYGHRNVQGLALRPGTSQMWSVEHGPSVDDEINLLVAGRNYGWNPVPGYNEGVPMTDLVEFPEAVEAKWSSGPSTLATSGGIFLEGEQWGVWEGRLAVATLADSKLRLFEFTPDGAFVSQVVVAELNGAYGRLRTPMMGPDGALYVTTSNGGDADRILRIAEDDPVPVTLTLTLSSIGENGGVSTVTASQDRVSIAATTVTISAMAVNPAAPGDFMLSANRTLTIPAGQTDSTGTVTVRAVNNNVDAPNTTLTVSGAADNIEGVAGPAALTLTIVDDDTAPEVTLKLTPSLISENGGVSTVTASLNRASSAVTTVAVSAVEVPPAVSGDFALSTNKTLTITAGQTISTGAVTITANNNIVDTPNKTVRVSGTADNSHGVTDPDDVTLTITDDDAAPVMTLEVRPAVIAEADGNSTVTVRITNGVTFAEDQEIRLSFAGTAAKGTDYTVGLERLILTAGQNSTATTVTAVDDAMDDEAETVLITARHGGGVLGAEQTITITDDDASPVIVTASPILVAENETAVATLTATDADRPAEDLTWRITGGADRNRFRLTADGGLTFAAAQDYEAPGDSDGNGDYEVTVEVTDGANPVEAVFTVRLEDVDDTAPKLSSALVNGPR